MNKLFSKIAALSVGLAMAVGVGVAVGSKSAKVVKAADVSVSISDYASANGWANQTAYESVVLDSNVTATSTGGSTSSSKYYSTDKTWRFYASDNGAMTIATTSGSLSSVTLTFTVKDNGKISYGSTALTSGTAVSVSGTSAVFEAGSSSGAKGKVFVTAIAVSYSGDTPTPSTTYTVTYDADGGTVSPASQEVAENTTISTFPTPAKEGYNFDGWFLPGESSPVSSLTVTADVTLTAHWSEVTPVIGEQIVFDDNGSDASAAITAETGLAYITQGADFVSNLSGISKVYKGITGLKFGSSSAVGTVTLEFASTNSFDGYTLFATFKGYGSDGGNFVFSSDAFSSSISLSKSSTTLEEFEVGTFESEPTTLTIATSLKRGYLKSLRFEQTAPVTKYSVIDRVDDGTLDKSEVKEGATLTVTITPDDGYALPTSLTYVRMAGSDVPYTYENGVVTVANVTGNVVIEGACVKVNQIQAIYSKASGASVDVYGYYVGYLNHVKDSTTYYDYIIQDGEYGVMAYAASATEPSFTEKETILHITGTVSIYKGLYEIASPVVEAVTSAPEGKVPATPVVYATKGTETAEYASRLTTVTGTPSVSGSFPETAGSSDITISMNLGTKSVQVFYKKAAQTADADAFAAMKAAVAGSTEITIKGFTSWYDGFQVQMNGYVPAAQDYTAEDFAQDLLDQTDAVCAGWTEGKNNHDALEAIWSDLASNDKYPSLPSDQKQILAEAARNPSGTVVEQAMARYDYLTGKYDLSNFINGREPVHVVRLDSELNIADHNTTMIIVIAIAATSAIALSLLLVLKKRKHN